MDWLGKIGNPSVLDLIFIKQTARKIGIYLSASINIALHGEPSTPDKFSGAAFNK